jgi:gamma-glutamylcyclotransferase (GGCT)/AIG2-like uncharacterized protein YtfP
MDEGLGRDTTQDLKVFVYGTLKPGEVNYARYCQGKVLAAQEAIVRGRLYQLPVGYPALTAGYGVIYGFLLTFADGKILAQLDELEGYYPHRPPEQNEYMRTRTPVLSLEHQPLGAAWVYCMSTVQVQKVAGVWLPQGKWSSKTG